MKKKSKHRIKINPKELAEGGDITEKEIRKRKWRIPRLWRKGKKLFFYDYAMSNDGIVIRIKRGRGSTYLGRKKGIGPDGNGYLALSLCLDKKQIQSIKLHRLSWETWKNKIPRKLEINHKDGIKSNNSFKNLEVITHKENCQHAMRMGLNWTEKQRKAVSEIHKGKKLSLEHKRKMSKARKGKKLSEETKKKISKANKGKNKGKKHSLETRKKLSVSHRGEKSYNSKLTQKEVDKILILQYKKSWMQQKIADKFKVSKGCVNSILQGYNWNPENLTKEELREKYGN